MDIVCATFDWALVSRTVCEANCERFYQNTVDAIVYMLALIEVLIDMWPDTNPICRRRFFPIDLPHVSIIVPEHTPRR